MSYLPSFFSQPLPPCYKTPILTGAGVASLLFAHNYRTARMYNRTLKHAVDVSTFGFLGTSVLSWWWCLKERKEKGSHIEQAMLKAGIKKQ